MSRRFYFKDSSGNTYIPVADGEFFTDQMSTDYSGGDCVVELFDANKNLVTGTGGTIAFASETAAGQWHTPNNGTGVIDATDVVAGDATYTLPTFNDGTVIRSRMTLSGVTGAVYVRAHHRRYA